MIHCLKQKFGKDLEDINKQNSKKILKIIERGKINNYNEHLLIMSRIDELCNMRQDQLTPEIELLDKLIHTFEK